MKKNKKLLLKKVTLKNLDDQQIAGVAGGISENPCPTFTDPPKASCCHNCANAE